MNRPEVLFVEPRGSRKNVFARQMNLPLLGPIYLASGLARRGIRARAINENVLRRPLGPGDLDADVLCLSLITLAAPRGMALARTFRARNPKGRIIVGGAHPSLVPEEFEGVADHVVVGEGEEVIHDLIRYGADTRIVEGPRVEDLDAVPVPDFSILRPGPPRRVTPVLTSRGCPYACEFCSVSRLFGRGYRCASVERAMEELRRVRTPDVFFYDDNFAAKPDRTRALMEVMIRENLRLSWTAQVRSEIARDGELLALMRRAGCVRVYVGFESVCDETLRSYHKAQTVRGIEEAIARFHEAGIRMHGMFILGGDEDPPDIFRRTVRFCRRHRIDTVQFLILTPLPGTPIYERFAREGRILHRNWSYYDGLHVVFRPAGWSAHELQEGMLQSFREFYCMGEAAISALEEVGLILKWTAARAFRRVLPPTPKALFILQGKTILRAWQRLNASYLRYLLRLSGAAPKTAG